jgi:dCMP deaminase
MSRLSFHSQWLCVAAVASLRATCSRRAVGCVLTDSRGRVLSTGYNGPASGLPHCTDSPCKGASLPSGTGLDACEAIHAEQNALTWCKDPSSIFHVYTTVSPCVHCTKMLLGTPANHIWFHERYAHDQAARGLWEAAGRTWTHRPLPAGLVEALGRLSSFEHTALPPL